MRKWIWWALVQIMACHIFGDKPLYERMLVISIGPLGISLSEISIRQFPLNKMHLKMSSAKRAAFLSRGDEITLYHFSQPHSAASQCLTIVMQNVFSSWSGAVYRHRRSGSTLVEIRACRLFGARPWSDQRLIYQQKDPIKWYLKNSRSINTNSGISIWIPS